MVKVTCLSQRPCLACSPRTLPGQLQIELSTHFDYFCPFWQLHVVMVISVIKRLKSKFSYACNWPEYCTNDFVTRAGARAYPGTWEVSKMSGELFSFLSRRTKLWHFQFEYAIIIKWLINTHKMAPKNSMN